MRADTLFIYLFILTTTTTIATPRMVTRSSTTTDDAHHKVHNQKLIAYKMHKSISINQSTPIMIQEDDVTIIFNSRRY
jgi:hypothetical protein